MSHSERLQKNISEKDTRCKDEWDIFLWTSIADSLAAIADSLEIIAEKKGDKNE